MEMNIQGSCKTGPERLPLSFLFVVPEKPLKFSIEWFEVEEIPLPFSRFRHGSEKYFVYRLEKKGIDIWQALKEMEKQTGLDSWKVGYSGIKDKQNRTIQYITLPARIDDFSTSSISVSFEGYSARKFKPGMLEGNRFRIKISGNHDLSAFSQAKMLNYYGLQRFGMNLDNHLKALKMGKPDFRNRKSRLILQSLQSWIFNESLNRIAESKIPAELPLFSKDMGRHGKLVEEIASSIGVEPWEERRIMRKTLIQLKSFSWKPEGNSTIVEFSLPKSSYATVVLQEMAKSCIRK